MLVIVSLILLGIVLMLVEMLLVPGVGIAGFGSLAALAGACWYTFEKVGTGAGILVTVIVVAILVVMLAFILSKKTWKRFALNDEISSQANLEVENVKAGDRGTTITRLAPAGTARIGGTTCEVKSFDNTMVDPGVDVEVIAVEDKKVIVKPIAQ